MKILSVINRDVFFSAWGKDNNNSGRDENAKGRLEFHKTQSFQYFLVELDYSDVQKLLLPWHIHENPVPPEGISIIEYGEGYCDKVLNFPSSPNNCIDRIKRALEWFNDPKDQPLFMFISDNPDISITGHFQGRTKDSGFLFAGSSHKFAAYAVWIKKYGFKPLTVYLATDNTKLI